MRKYDTTKPNITTSVNVDKKLWYEFKLIFSRLGMQKKEAMENAIKLFNSKNKEIVNDDKELELCYNCGKERPKDETGAFICPCQHCGNQVPF